MIPVFTKNKFMFLLLTIVLIGISGCSKDEEPGLVYDPNKIANPDPKIISVSPSDYALADYTNIVITGQNFSTTTDTIKGNFVYFNEKKGKVISASATQLVVVPPIIESESVSIKVVSPGAYYFAEYKPYKIKYLKQRITQLQDPDDETGSPIKGQLINGFDIGPDESIYALSRLGVKGVLTKISPTGTLINSPEFPNQPSVITSEIKYGPQQYIYWLRGTGNGKIIYRILPVAGVPEVWATFPQNVQFFDFDKEKNIYAVGKEGMFYASAEGTVIVPVGDYSGYSVKGIKVTEAYVYVLGTNSNNTAGLWRSKIMAAGTLGNAELIFNWAEAGEFASYSFSSFTLSASLDVYIASNNPQNPVLLIHPDGTMSPLYPGQLPSFPELTTGTWQLTWGNTEHLYLYRTGTNIIFKVFAGQDGVPYYGRE